MATEVVRPVPAQRAATPKAIYQQKRAWIVLLLILCLIAPQFMSGYIVYFMSLAAIQIIVAIGLNILMGYAGQISIGHAGFYAIGAYTSALVMLRLDLPFPVALVAGGLVAGIIGLILGVPALRLSGLYLAIATLGFGVAVPQIILHWESLSGGHMGLKPPRPEIAGFVFDSDVRYYYLAFAVMVLMIFLAYWLLRTKGGRAWIALRDSETAAQAMGINLAYYKTLAFAVSAFYTGVAGSLMGHLVNFVSPEGFTLAQSIYFLTFIVVGGIASIPGSILGAIFLTALPQLLSGVKDLPMIIYGASLILVVMFLPGGLVEIGAKLTHLVWRARRRRAGLADEDSFGETNPLRQPEV